MLTSSRQEARRLGLKWYRATRPCPAGHQTTRYAINGGCTECQRLRAPVIAQRYSKCVGCGARIRNGTKRGTKWCSVRCRNKEQAVVQRRERPEAALVRGAKLRARRLGLPFDLRPDDITIPALCPAIGIPMRCAIGTRGPKPGSPSLDRLVPELGYVRGNVRVISWRANRIKCDGTLPELRGIVAYLEGATCVT